MEPPEEPQVNVKRRAAFEDVEQMLAVRIDARERRAASHEPFEIDSALG